MSPSPAAQAGGVNFKRVFGLCVSQCSVSAQCSVLRSNAALLTTRPVDAHLQLFRNGVLETPYLNAYAPPAPLSNYASLRGEGGARGQLPHST
jgi:hypothetical protein